jgi:hypothetical protein
MPSATPAAMRERAHLVEDPGLPPGWRRRRLLAWTMVVVVLMAAGAYVELTDRVSQHTSTGPQDNSAATSTQTVTRRSLSQTTSVPGTLGYAGDYTVLGQAEGTVTWLPQVGRVIHRGRVLYRVDGHPVVLLYGSTPAYRTLAVGVTAGRDVAELNHDLVALGYVAKSAVAGAWDEFSWATGAGVERLQDHLGVDQTGQLALGDDVVLPAAARVTRRLAKLGGPAGGPVLSATATRRQITVDLDAAQQSEVKAGDRVTITLPNNQTTPGKVSSMGKVANPPSPSGSGGPSNGTPTVTVHIRPTRPADTGRLDQAPVQVAITGATVHHVLAVPVNALVALSGGGYAVEVVGSGGAHRLVRVRLGLFDDAAGLVQVSGSRLAAGQRVVVPAP